MNQIDLGILFQIFTPNDFKFRAPNDLLVLWNVGRNLKSLVLYEFTSIKNKIFKKNGWQ